jgi:dethiobiotin synthetase
MPASALFVTATDTGVGKTTVAGALAELLSGRGIDVGVMKPVATGARRIGETLVSDDVRFLSWAAGIDGSDEAVCPACYEAPLAPWVAAREEGLPVNELEILAAYQKLVARHQVLIIEGIGGILVPLTEGLSVAGLARRLDAPLLIVARAGLGTINHTLLTLEASRREGLDVRGVLLNRATPDPPGPAERTNLGALRELTCVPILGSLDYDEAVSVEGCRLGNLPQQIERMVDLTRLFPGLTFPRLSPRGRGGP